MSITDVNFTPGPNICVQSKPSILKYCKSPQAIHDYCEISQKKPAILYVCYFLKVLVMLSWVSIALYGKANVPITRIHMYQSRQCDKYRYNISCAGSNAVSFVLFYSAKPCILRLDCSSRNSLILAYTVCLGHFAR